ncbi:MAG: hypothetical protein DMF84_15870 [Acidobacteria bacterium]|nr:MAG: hypothetical protein DMF84_15870 [Acidobacteriota bacterium]
MRKERACISYTARSWRIRKDCWKEKGNQGRFIRLENPATVDKPAVVALLRPATKLGKTPLPKTGRGYTVIKSVSAKQRPRRPPSRSAAAP